MIEQFNSEYEYCAFISFDSDNAKVATWLRKKLDKFSIPNFIRSQYKIERKYLNPSYTYLHASEAGNELREELAIKIKKSRYFILICSPESAKSEICNWEVQTFIDLGRKEYIIPLIIEGEPYSDDPSLECLCPAIKDAFPRSEKFDLDRQIKCANLNEKGVPFYERKDHAFAQIVARILSVNSDKIWDYVRHALQKKVLLTGILSFILLISSISAFLYYRTSYEYFFDYADCNGLPSGIIPIKKSDIENYQSHYRFEFSKKMLNKVVYCNSKGLIIDHHHTEYNSRPAIIEFLYDSDNEIIVTNRDAYGRFLTKMRVSSDRSSMEFISEKSHDAGTINGNTTSMFTPNTSAFMGAFFDVTRLTQTARAKISRWVFDRDDDGFITRQLYKKYKGEQDPAMDLSGIYGVLYERDSLHRIVKESFLSVDGATIKENNVGIAYKTHKYDDRGCMIETRYYNEYGELTLNEMKFAVCKAYYAPDGTYLEESYYDTHEKLCLGRYGVARKRMYFEEGLEAREENYNLVDSLTIAFPDSFTNNPGGWAICRYTYNDKGEGLSMSFYDKNDMPCNCDQKFHKMEVEYEDGYPITQKYYNTDNIRCVTINGFSKCSGILRNGELVSIQYFNVDDRPMNNIQGYSRLDQEFKNGKVVSQRYYNMFGVLVAVPNIGYAGGLDIEYNSVGNPEHVTWVGFNDSPMINSYGFAQCKIVYDSQNPGLISEYHYMNENGSPVKHIEGYTNTSMEYNQQGQVVRVRYFNNNIPCLNERGFHELRNVYNENGLCVQITTYDTLSKLVDDKLTGGARIESEYDDGLQISYRLFNAEGDPVIDNVNGCHCMRFKYDELNRNVSKSSWNTRLEPMNNINLGAHDYVMVYDNRNNLVEEATYDTNGNLVECGTGAAKCISVYDEQNNLIQKYYLDKNEEPTDVSLNWSKAEYEYDKYNQMISERYFNKSGKPCLNERGFSEHIMTYNEFSLPLTEVFYDDFGELVEVFSQDKQSLYAYAEMTYKDKTLIESMTIYDDAKNKKKSIFNFYDDYDSLYVMVLVSYDDPGSEIGNIISIFNVYIGEVSNLSGEKEKYAELLKEQYGCIVNPN